MLGCSNKHIRGQNLLISNGGKRKPLHQAAVVLKTKLIPTVDLSDKSSSVAATTLSYKI